MNFSKHLEIKEIIKDRHAFLSPSKYHWLRYDDERLEQAFMNSRASEMGVRLHEFASEAIQLGVKLKGTRDALSCFVNDAIGFRMESEQLLYYSEYCFGTADAISFRKDVLRIHDLKTGVSKASFDQLKVYAAIFCLEYRVKPCEIGTISLRIYQHDGYEESFVESGEIDAIILTIQHHNEFIKSL